MLLLSLAWAFVQVLCAYTVVDALVGLYHWATDYGYNTPDMVRKFKEHHVDPLNMLEFDWQPMPPGILVMLVGLAFGSSFVAAFGSFLVLAQVPHYYTHRRSRSPIIHRTMRLLQRLNLVASPESHHLHHDGKFDRNFCVLSGWNNWWLNWLAAPRPKAAKRIIAAHCTWCGFECLANAAEHPLDCYSCGRPVRCVVVSPRAA